MEQISAKTPLQNILPLFQGSPSSTASHEQEKFTLYYDAGQIGDEFDSVASRYVGFGPWKACLYDLLMGFWERPANVETMRLIKASGKTGKILELGVGSGHLLSLIAKSFPESEITGVDYSVGMIEASKRLLSKRLPLKKIVYGTAPSEGNSSEELRFVQCDCFHLPACLEGQDIIASSFLFDIQPSERIAQLLDESTRLLKHGGRLFIAVLDGAVENSSRNWFSKRYFSMANELYQLCYGSDSMRRLSHRLFNGYYTHCRPIDIESRIERSQGLSVARSAVCSIRICGIPFLPVRIVEAIRK